MQNTVDTTQVDKLTPEHIRNLVMLATDAGVALPTNFLNAVYKKMYDDPRTLEDMAGDWPAEFFEVMAWQDRLNCECNETYKAHGSENKAMNVKTTFKLTGEEIAQEDTRTNRFSIRNISEIDMFDLVTDARSAGLKLPTSLTSMINWACYHDMHFDGPFFMLTANDEFLDCLAWHDTLDD